ncbi:MAG: shikimate kinase [Planctomycetaceae bacterium]
MVITLIGYRGSGKTAVAEPLARRLGWSWVDADVAIESRAGRSIREIFERDGEAGFRDMERLVIQELLQRTNVVIAAGGGAILDGDTRSELRAAGPVVWLMASVETLLGRIEGDHTTQQRRPSLTGQTPRDEVLSVLAERMPLYQECATVIVATDNQTVDQVVERIRRSVEDVYLEN